MELEASVQEFSFSSSLNSPSTATGTPESSVASTSSTASAWKRQRTHKSVHLHVFETTLDEEDEDISEYNDEQLGAPCDTSDHVEPVGTTIDFRNQQQPGLKGDLYLHQQDDQHAQASPEVQSSDSSHVGSLSQEAGIDQQQTFIFDAGTSAAPEIVMSSSDQRTSSETGQEQQFEWINFSEDQVTIPNEFRKRAVETLKAVVPTIISQDSEEEKGPVTTGCTCCCTTDHCVCCNSFPALITPPELRLSVEMKAARLKGFNITKDLFIPTLPTFVTIIWVIVELLVTLSQFVFSIVTVNIMNNTAYNIAYLSLASLNVVLACIDGIFFFISFNKVQNAFKKCCCRTRQEQNSHVSDDKSSSTSSQVTVGHSRKCCTWKNWKNYLAQWTELIRNVLSELLLYPLVVFDLFELIDSRLYEFQSTDAKVSFSYFIIGLFFLVVSVYITRLLIAIMTLRTVRKLPIDFTGTGNETVGVLTRFLFHALSQLVVHMMCIIAVAAKIFQENHPDRVATGTVYVSPMLWVVLFTSWVVPLMGTFMFFPVNYFWIEQFSIGMYMNIVGLLQEKSFAEAVFTTKTVDHVQESCEKFFKEVKFVELKRQAKARQSLGLIYRLFYPLRTPVFYFVAPVYAITLAAFIVSLMISVDETTGAVTFSLFDQGSVGVTIVICILITIMVNYQFVILASLLLVAVAAIVITLPLALLGAATLLIPCLPLVAHYIIKKMRSVK